MRCCIVFRARINTGCRVHWRIGVVLLGCAVIVSAQTRPVAVVIQTNFGSIDAEIDTVHAPVTAANFLKYVDAGYYNGGQFHRTVKPDNQPNNQVRIEVVQAGIKSGAPEFSPIALERTSLTGLLHRDGTMSMARNGPDTATADFFICIGAQPSLDFGGKRNSDDQGFAAFGQVVKGMDVVRKIQAAPAQEQTLTPVVRMLKISRK
jgi:peptidyl-prolyl cis-trans isomerase A (cyclophilin A)